MKKIILMGYMGSGKSSVANIVSEILQMEMLDLDSFIENKLQKSIAEIFSDHGEIFFRKLEHQVLSELLFNDASFVLALGGGTPCYANNHLLLEREGVVSFYLKSTVNTLIKRLQQDLVVDPNGRPLIAKMNPEMLYDFVGQHLFERNYYYHHATHVIDTDDKDISEVALAIVALT
jgi:shikimate kinase